MTWRRVGILAALLGAVLVAFFIVVQTGWFRDYAREQIVSLTEEATGGKVDLNAFEWDVWHLHATLRDFTIHGSEPPDAAPFLRVAKADAEFRLFPGLRHLYQISLLTVESPRINVMELPDGRTNIPSPRRKSTSDTSALQTVVDLAVGRFDLTNGEATLDDHKEPLTIRGNNLVAQLSWNAGRQSYQGQLSLQPVYVVAGRNTPVIFTVRLPVFVERDRIEIQNGAISTPISTLALHVSLENMRNPKFSGHVDGSIALTDLQNLANLPLATETRGAPRTVSIDVNATASQKSIDVSGINVSLGDSSIAASGLLKDPAGRGSLAFKIQLAVGELSRLLRVSAKPEGLLLADGNASLRGNTGANAAWNYLVTGNMEARNVSFQQGGHRVSGIQLSSLYRADPHAVELNDLRLTALGGEFTGHAGLQDFAKYKLDGNLRNLNLQTALRAAGEQLPYDAVISGPVSAEGDTKVPGTKSLAARAALSLVPGRRGIPLSGRLNANFSGAADNVTVTSSYLNLAHTRVTLDGSVNNHLNFSLTSRDLNDLLAAASLKGPAPVALNGGQLTFSGSVTGGLSDPRIAGSVAANRFGVEGRQFDSLNLDLLASSSRASITSATLTRGAMQTHLTAAVGLKRWTAPPYEPVAVDASIGSGDLADIAAMAGHAPAGFSGALSASVHITGTVGNPQGTANLQVTDGTIAREPFNQLQAQFNLTDRQVTIPTAYIQSGAGRVNLTAEFSHPPDRFTTGRLHAHLQSNPVNLAEIRQVQEQKSAVSGTLQVNADVIGDVTGNTGSEFLPLNITADAQGRGLRLRGLDYGNLDATARTSGQLVAYNLTLGAFTSTIRLNGNTGLTQDYPTTADANINNISIDHFLLLANRGEFPARGNLSGTLHVDGTAQKPHATANLDLSRAVIYDEPVDNIRAQGTYLDSSIEISQLEVVSGPAKIALTGRYDHPAGNLEQGDAHFDVTSSQVDLSRIRNISKIRPGFGGVVQINASGAAQVRVGDPKILLTSLSARVAASAVKAQGRNLGDLTFTANTNTSSQVNFNLDSDLGGSSIRGRGTAELMGDYRVDAQLTFANVLYSRLQPLLSPAAGTPAFEVATDGEAAVKGPIFKTDQLGGSFQLSRLSVTAMPQAGGGKPITISNQGPIAATLDRGVVRIQSARLVGPSTDISAAGTASVTGQSLNLTLNANADLGILPSFDRDIYSSGKVVVTATVGGNASVPRINGQMTLQDAAFNYTGITNGISNANGVIAFNGNNATIRNLNAESGGGKIALSGFIGYANGMRFGVTANAKGVRMRAEQGISVTTAADIRLTGTMENSLVSGTVTIDQLTYNPQSDIGSILSRAAPPVQSPTAPSPFLDNMRLEVRVRSSTGVAVQASLAQNLRADVDLRVRGTASLPAVLGRVTINEGQLVFFGSSYTVDNGTIAFYNPVRIEPMLDIALETQAQGVRVTLRVTGPIDNMKLSYTSDPPLQFQEIVSLLAAGKTPTSDPTLLANQPQTPQQSFQQMGESAIVSKALADPVSSRLERVFGVTQLKIDPAFQTGSQVPTARLTLQQQITSNLTFTYTSALDDPNGQIVKIEWAFSPQFSAIANRDQNGIFSINFFYKRSFR